MATFKKVLRNIGITLYSFRYFFMKLGIALLTLATVVVLNFILIVNIPGSVIDAFALELANSRRIPIEQATILAKQMLNYDPDSSLFSRFSIYIQQLLNGNLGNSIRNNAKSVNVIIRELLPNTIFVSGIALAISFLLGVFMGTRVAQKRKNKIANGAFNSYVVVSSAIPDYIVALIFILIFSFNLNIFPNIGAHSPYVTPGFNMPFILSYFYFGALPILTLVFAQMSFWAMQMRGSAIGTMGEDYIQAARARGIPEKVIAKKYIKKNAILPLITQLAISFGIIFGGSPLIEIIFSYPGIGQELSTAIGQRDYYVVQGILLFISIIVIGVNLIVDLLYSFLDPRIRRST